VSEDRTESASEVPAAAPPPPPPRARRGVVRRSIRAIGLTLLGLAAGMVTLWSAAAVYYADTHAGPRTLRALGVVAIALALVLVVRPKRYALVGIGTLFLIVVGWFFSLKPSNGRSWVPEIARLARAEVDGDRLTIRNVRDFDYRSETDFTPRWADRTYDLARLQTVDLMLVYWGSKAIAHAMVSFEFDDGRHLAVSVETRKETGESYSTVQGFFRQYELAYVFADERDVIRLRTRFRNEDVYLYRTTVGPEQARAVLLSYARTANALAGRPQFYNALTSNCATNVLDHAREGTMPAQMSLDVLLSGYAARQAYRNGRLDTSLPFEELERRSHVNAAALAADADPNFSNAIRAGLPNPARVAAGSSGGSSPAPTRPAP
jgi:hypothetical protein